jgi:hypothetical protein
LNDCYAWSKIGKNRCLKLAFYGSFKAFNVMEHFFVLFIFSFFNKLYRCCHRAKELNSRTVWIGSHSQRIKDTIEYYPPNGLRNQKYNLFTFLPMVLSFCAYSIFLADLMHCHLNFHIGLVSAIQIFSEPLFSHNGY